MTPVLRNRIRHRGVLAPSPNGFHLPEIPRRGIGWRELIWALVFLGAWASLFSMSLIFRDSIPLDELVTIVDVKEPPPPPPPPPKEEPVKPKDIEPPKPVPPDPDQPPPPPSSLPPQPQFGLPEDATSANGGFAVATGNSLMTKPDEVVKKPPVATALPPAPPIQSSFDAQVVQEILPEYPAWAEEQGVQAVVDAMITLDEKGKVSDFKILRSAGNDFDVSARRAIYATIFKPLIDHGKPVPCRIRYKFKFQL